MFNGLITNDSLQERFIYKNAFTSEECELIINNPDLKSSTFSGEYREMRARSYSLKKNQETEWILERIMSIINQVNQLYYHFKITCLENIQFIEYLENSYYNWHIDISGLERRYWTRKLNAVVFLSNPKDYEGGQLRFNLNEREAISEVDQEQGSMIFFPSYQPHIVEKITKGRRYTFSAIAHGDSFR
jgi:predicted 2-oxoglutarate/Fe(II)-dependent dioxygenase YbiX